MKKIFLTTIAFIVFIVCSSCSTDEHDIKEPENVEDAAPIELLNPEPELVSTVFDNDTTENASPDIFDGARFATEYMEFNGELRSNGEPHYVLDIPEDVHVFYLEADEVITKLESGTGMINLGFPMCPWCREIVPYLIDLTRQNNTPLYYMNIQPIRDVQELDESGEVITVTEGTPEYYKMVELLYDWLWEYKGLEDPNIKRIYVPTTIFVKEGEIQYVHIATLRENYDDGYIPLDDLQSEQVTNYLSNAVMQISNNRNGVDDGCDECP